MSAEPLSDAVARSLDAHAALLPFLSELLADLEELGTSADDVVDVLRPLGLPASTRAIDLGCGKGAVAVALAEELGFRVTGIDGFAPFVDDAQRVARARGVEARCEFRVGDLRQAVDSAGQFDVALLMAVGPVFGNMEQTIGALRRCVRPGGYMVIEDVYLDEQTQLQHVPEAYAEYAGREETLRRLQAHGDQLVAEQLFPHSEVEAVNAENTAKIRRRAEKLSAEQPHLAELFAGYVATQEDECEALEGPLIGAIWVLKRGETSCSPDIVVPR
jgi:cyclopropane fatty-acyl-phospholipid synthase-like methyltransferase